MAVRLPHLAHLSSSQAPRLPLILQEKADPETARLHVGHLTRNVEASHVQEIFGSFGTLKVGPAPLGPQVLSWQSCVLHAPTCGLGCWPGSAQRAGCTHGLDHLGCSRLPLNRVRFQPGGRSISACLAALHPAARLHWLAGPC